MSMPSAEPIWAKMREEARSRSETETVLASLFHSSILNHASMESALSSVLAARLETAALSPMALREIFDAAIASDDSICGAACADLVAHRTRDPACESYVEPFLNFKGFHALQTYRIAHWLWRGERKWLAFLLQGRSSTCFGVDIHPGAVIGHGIMIDHGNGIVIGETARVGNNVSMLHGVTLGGSGRSGGNRHPRIGRGVLFGAGARVLGPVSIGDGAKIGAGSVVLENVPAHVTVAGVPARIVGKPRVSQPALEMDQTFSAPPDPGPEGG